MSNEAVARINDAIVELNSCISLITANDTVEFDVEKRLDVLDVAVDDLKSDVDSTVEFTEDTSG